MLQFIQERVRAFIRSNWFCLVVVLVATLPLVPMCVKLVCAPLHYLSGNLLKVLLCGWALAVLGCWGRRALQDPDKRGCETTFIVTSLKWAVPATGIILVNEVVYMVADWSSGVLLSVVGPFTTVVLSLLGFGLAWLVTVRPASLLGIDQNSRTITPQVVMRKRQIVTHDLRSHKRTADFNYTRLVPLQDERSAQMSGYGEHVPQEGETLVISKGKGIAVWWVQKVTTDKDNRWHARVRTLPTHLVTWKPVEA